MRRRINLAEYNHPNADPEGGRRLGLGVPVETEPEEDTRVDEYREVKKETLKWLNLHYRDILSNPRRYKADIERAIMMATSQSGVQPEQMKRLRAELMDSILGAGALQKFLDDPTVTEIMVVGAKVWTERDGVLSPELPLESAREGFAVADDMAAKAGYRFQGANPLITLTWEDGSRVNLVHTDCSPLGAAITIRKRDMSRPLELDDLVNLSHGLSAEIADFLKAAVAGRLNVLLSGSTGSGKTTLLRALANATFDNPNERVLVLEETEELRLRHPHTVNLVAKKATDGKSGVGISMRQLFLHSLQMRPDRIVIGEVRGEEALDAIEAAKAEHGGMLFTMHLRNPEQLGGRMYWISQHFGMAIDKSELIREVYEAVNVVVQMDKLRDGRRRVTRVCEPVGVNMVDLFKWDSSTDTHVKVNDLSDTSRQWMEDAMAGKVKTEEH